MRTTRNVIIALGLLVFLYGGIYCLFARKEIVGFAQFGDPFDYSGDGGWKRRIFAPATELDLRLSIDRRVRRALAGNWISSESGDYLVISTADKCSFRLGEFEYSGNVEVSRHSSTYVAQFHHAGAAYRLWFTNSVGMVGPPLSDHFAQAVIFSDHQNDDHSIGEVLYHATLIRAPEPDR